MSHRSRVRAPQGVHSSFWHENTRIRSEKKSERNARQVGAEWIQMRAQRCPWGADGGSYLFDNFLLTSFWNLNLIYVLGRRSAQGVRFPATTLGFHFIADRSNDTLAERLRRRPAKPMGSPRVGSNPTGVVLLSSMYSCVLP